MSVPSWVAWSSRPRAAAPRSNHGARRRTPGYGTDFARVKPGRLPALRRRTGGRDAVRRAPARGRADRLGRADRARPRPAAALAARPARGGRRRRHPPGGGSAASSAARARRHGDDRDRGASPVVAAGAPGGAGHAAAPARRRLAAVGGRGSAARRLVVPRPTPDVGVRRHGPGRRGRSAPSAGCARRRAPARRRSPRRRRARSPPSPATTADAVAPARPAVAALPTSGRPPAVRLDRHRLVR